MAYDDGRIACTDDGLVIRWYYFPAGRKRVPYGAIQQVRRRPLGAGKGRIWGSTDFIHWYNLDPARPGKSAALDIQLSGHAVTPVITPDDPDALSAELAARGVAVEGQR